MIFKFNCVDKFEALTEKHHFMSFCSVLGGIAWKKLNKTSVQNHKVLIIDLELNTRF